MKKRRRGAVPAILAAVLLLAVGGAVLAARHTAGERAEPPGFLEGVCPAAPIEQIEPAQDVFTLYDQSTDKTVTLTAEELLPGAVACEMDLSSPVEALKAQAAACYTLFCRKRAAGEEIVCDSRGWQVWTDWEQMKARWGEDADGFLELLKSVTEQVQGQVITWEGEPILAAYFAISAGATETAGNVWQGDLPYLRAAASPGDVFSDGYLSEAVFDHEQFRAAASAFFSEDPPELSGSPETWLTDVVCSPSGYVISAKLGGREVTGPELRSTLSLRSAAFTVEHGKDGFTFTVRGWGHGVGMSQAGAVWLAKRGADWKEILAYYYPGTELSSLP